MGWERTKRQGLRPGRRGVWVTMFSDGTLSWVWRVTHSLGLSRCNCPPGERLEAVPVTDLAVEEHAGQGAEAAGLGGVSRGG